MVKFIAQWKRQGALGLGAALVAVLSVTSAAGAHVTVHPAALPAGSSDIELTFRVPNERDNANTIETQVFFPTSLPLLTVDVLPIPGWTATVITQNLAKPVQTDDGPVSQIVSEVTWKATGAGIEPGQYEDFVVAAGAAPSKPGSLVFKALQTYSSGEVVRWIEVPTTQDPNPPTPAPVLTLTANPTASVQSPTTSSGSSGSGSAQGLAIAALTVAVVGLVGVVILFLRGRRGVSS